MENARLDSTREEQMSLGSEYGVNDFHFHVSEVHTSSGRNYRISAGAKLGFTK
jgi:carbonic anhydrase